MLIGFNAAKIVFTFFEKNNINQWNLLVGVAFPERDDFLVKTPSLSPTRSGADPQRCIRNILLRFEVK